MNNMTQLTIDIKPSQIESGIVEAPFDEGLSMLVKNGLELISLPQNAQLRIQQGKGAYVSQNGNWVREGLIYTPKGKPKLVRNSPILLSAKEATQAHREGKEFYQPNTNILESSLVDSIDFPEENTEIPTNRFNSNTLMVYAFGGEKEAQAYGEFLKEAGITNIPIWAVDKNYVNKQTQPFARQLWFGGLDDDGSGLIGGSRLVDDDGRVRGVRLNSGEAGARKNSEPIKNSELYTPAQITSALTELGMPGLEKQILGQLKAQ